MNNLPPVRAGSVIKKEKGTRMCSSLLRRGSHTRRPQEGTRNTLRPRPALLRFETYFVADATSSSTGDQSVRLRQDTAVEKPPTPARPQDGAPGRRPRLSLCPKDCERACGVAAEQGPAAPSNAMGHPPPPPPPPAESRAHRCPAVQSVYDPKDRLRLLRCKLNLDAAAEVVPCSQQRRVRLVALEVGFACNGVRSAV